MPDPKPDYLQVYADFWAPLVETDGVLDRDKVARELFDYSGLLDEVPKVYDHVTGGLVSKPNTHARAVIALADDHLSSICNDNVKEETEELRAELEASRAAHAALLTVVKGWHEQAKGNGTGYAHIFTTSFEIALQEAPVA